MDTCRLTCPCSKGLLRELNWPKAPAHRISSCDSIHLCFTAQTHHASSNIITLLECHLNWLSHSRPSRGLARAEAKTFITCALAVYLPFLDNPAVDQFHEPAEHGRLFLHRVLSTRLHYALGPLGLALYGFYTLCDYCVPALVQTLKNKLPGGNALDITCLPTTEVVMLLVNQLPPAWFRLYLTPQTV